MAAVVGSHGPPLLHPTRSLLIPEAWALRPLLYWPFGL